ncbi:hypothetical protein [uncultured Corynebacterium sp.]|uniref:hypothetical protein n=1 Tax=uncultured Corynebacterium sp. TaxID=159447 RepID=UPI0025E98DE3|nr:hypothetical protein [uncultured Corynebacterium sp.]
MTKSVDGVPRIRDARVPDRAQVAAARLIIKRDREGKGNIRITDRIRRIAEFQGYDG